MRMNKPFVVLTLLLSFEEEIIRLDCLLRINGGGVVVLSSDLVCRGGIGGGRGTLVPLFFNSTSKKRTKSPSIIEYFFRRKYGTLTLFFVEIWWIGEEKCAISFVFTPISFSDITDILVSWVMQWNYSQLSMSCMFALFRSCSRKRKEVFCMSYLDRNYVQYWSMITPWWILN